MRWALASFLVLGLAAPLLAAADAPPQTQPAKGWPGCCGLPVWAEPGPLKAQPRSSTAIPLARGWSYIVGGSSLRHHLGVTGQIPAKYAKLSNPLPATPQNAQRGATVYQSACASCHGADGLGDGPASTSLKPPPAHLGWLSKIPAHERDAFLYWSVADGGTAFKSAMPSYKGKLTDDEIWAVIGYIQARLPASQAPSSPTAQPQAR